MTPLHLSSPDTNHERRSAPQFLREWTPVLLVLLYASIYNISHTGMCMLYVTTTALKVVKDLPIPMRCLCCRRGRGRCGRGRSSRGRSGGRRLLGSLGGHVLVKGSGSLGFRGLVDLVKRLRWQKTASFAGSMPDAFGLLRKMLPDRGHSKTPETLGQAYIWSWGTSLQEC